MHLVTLCKCRHFCRDYTTEWERVCIRHSAPDVTAVRHQRARGASSSSMSASSPSGSFSRKTGRPPASFETRIATLLKNDIADNTRHHARTWLIYGHLMTLKAMKLSLMGYTGCIGMSTDDTTKMGREICGVRIRSGWIRPPLSEEMIMSTIPILPLFPRKMTKGDVLKVLQRNKSTRKIEDNIVDFEASAKMSSIVKAVEDLCIPGKLGEDFDLAVMVDKGPLRKFFVNEMARGLKVTCFYDPHHVEDRAAQAVARRNLHPSVKHILKVRTSSLGVHTPKLSHALNISAKELDDEQVLKIIGNLREDLRVESGCLSTDVEHLVPAFREQAAEMSSRIGKLSNCKWLKELYAIDILEDRYAIFRAATRVAYAKEHGIMKEEIAAVKKINKRKCISYVSYSAESLDALSDLIKERVKPLKMKGTDQTACFFF